MPVRHAALILPLVFAGLGGCVIDPSTEVLDLPTGHYAYADYDFTVTQFDRPVSLDVHLGEARVLNTFHPDSTYRAGIMRPFGFDGTGSDQPSHGNTILSTMGSCSDGGSHCTHGVAVDLEGHLPMRFMFGPLDFAETGPRADATTPSTYLGNRTASLVWDWLPLFLPAAALVGDTPTSIYGRPITITSSIDDREHRVDWDWRHRFTGHVPSYESATVGFRGSAWLSDSLDPLRATMTMSQDGEDIVDYVLELRDHGPVIDLADSPGQPATSSPPSSPDMPCGAQFKAPFFPQSEYDYDQALDAVRAHTRYRNAAGTNGAILMGVTRAHEDPSLGEPLPTARWVWRFQFNESALEFTVIGPRGSSTEPVQRDFQVIDVADTEGTAHARSLLLEPCLGIDRLVGVVARFLDNAELSGLRQVDTALNTFFEQWIHDGNSLAEPRGYLLAARPTVEGPDGETHSTTLIQWSVITGELVSVF